MGSDWLAVRHRDDLRHALVRALVLGVIPGMFGCGQPPTSPTTKQGGVVAGTVRGSDGPIAGAVVEVTDAPGGSVTTGTSGGFLFKLPPGLIRLRGSKVGYFTRELDVIVRAGAPVDADVVLQSTALLPRPPAPPYAVRGVVRNGRGAVVAGADVWIYGNSSPIDNRYGTTVTDGAGRYSVTSAERLPQAVRVLKNGHVTRDVSILGAPDAPSTWTVDVVLVHIDTYALLPLPTLAVGQTARLEAQIELDDSSSNRGLFFQQLTSSNPSVLEVQGSGSVQGVAPGTATVTASYYGATTTLPVRVQ
jgi:hypothetical protein